VYCRIAPLLLHITPYLKHICFLRALIHQVRRIRQMGNWSMRKGIDGCSVLRNTSLVSLVTINNSELIYMSHKKSHTNKTRYIYIYIYIYMSCRKFTNLFILAGLGDRLFCRMWSYDTFPENFRNICLLDDLTESELWRARYIPFLDENKTILSF
jgi:hypothetical protein